MPLRVSVGAASAAAMFCLCFAASARAEAIPVFLDCALGTETVDCGEIARAYFDSLRGRIRSASEGRVRLVLRATSTASGVYYSVDATEPPETRVFLQITVPRAVTHEVELMRVLELLQRATVPFFRLGGLARDTGGALALPFDVEAGSERPEPRSASPVYLRPAADAELGEQGARIASLGGRLELGWSTPNWRFLGRARGAWKRLKLRIPGTADLEGDVWTGESGVLVARSLGQHATVALLADATRAPARNIRRALAGGPGIEWLLHSVQTAAGVNAGVQGQLKLAQQHYVTPNREHDRAATLVRPRAAGFVSWHGERLDLAGGVSAATVVGHTDAWDANGSFRATLRLTSAIELDVRGEATLRGRPVHTPADPDALDPVAAILDGNDFEHVSYGAAVSLAYVFGNELLHAQDQRWRN